VLAAIVAAGCFLAAEGGPPEGEDTPPPVSSDEEIFLSTQLRGESERLFEQSKFAEAAGRLEKACDIWRKSIGNDSGEVSLAFTRPLRRLAEMYELADDPVSARKTLEEILSIETRHRGESAWQAKDAKLEIARLDRVSSLPEEGRRELLRLRDLRSRYQETGKVGTLQDTLALMEEAVSIAKRWLGDGDPRTAALLSDLGSVTAEKGDFAGAEALHRQALAIQKESLGEENPYYPILLEKLASFYASRGEYARAEPLFQQAIEIWRKVRGENAPELASAIWPLAELYDTTGDYARAEPLHLEAIEILKRTVGESDPRYATSLDSLGTHYHGMGDLARSRSAHEQALAVRRRMLPENDPAIATSLNNLAMVCDSMGDQARAADLMRQSLATQEKGGGENTPGYAITLDNLASIHHRAGSYRLAAMLRRRALEIWKRTVGEGQKDYAIGLCNLADDYRGMGDLTNAEQAYRQGTEILGKAVGRNNPFYGKSLDMFATLYRLNGDDAQAAQLERQAVEIALSNLELASAVQSERQQLAMAADLRELLDGYLSVVGSVPAQAEGAYDALLRWKGSVLSRQRLGREALGGAEAVKLNDALAATTRRLATLAFTAPPPKALETWREEIDDLTAEKERLEAELSRASATYRARRQAERRNGRELSASLPAGTALVDIVEYAHSSPPTDKTGRFDVESRLAAFILTPDGGPIWVPLGPSEAIRRAVDRWLTSRGRGPEAAEAARKLQTAVWKRIDPLVSSASTILFSPDGPLTRFPIGVLPGREPGTFLIEERAIATIAVPHLLPDILGSRPDPTSGSLLALGDVNYAEEPGRPAELTTSRTAGAVDGRRPSFGALPNTAAEIASVKASFERRFPASTVTVLRGEEATEARLREEAPRHRYLHLATHGFFAPASWSALRVDPGKTDPESTASRGSDAGFHPGLLSGLALAGANRDPAPNRDDGILTALEVGAIDLRKTDLVVLSACESALGEESPSEGLLGLQRAFQVAGVRTVVATLWSVDDASARELMERFYSNLWGKKLPRLEALRRAQIEMLRGRNAKSTTPHTPTADSGARGVIPIENEGATDSRRAPEYWAAFVLSGDWR
jgi:CHAT domain-containing protein